MDHNGAAPAGRHIAARLAPFVAWLASQESNERIRRDYREAIEHYLVFQLADDGQAESCPSRYVAAHPDVDPQLLRTALERLAEHDAVVRLSMDY